MSTEEKRDAIQNAVAQIAPIVKQIEALPETTKGHYGMYMQVLSKSMMPERLADLLILAGANRFGVTSALTLVK